MAPSSTGVALSAVIDGASNTFAVIEDAGRISPASAGTPYYTPSAFFDTFTGTLSDGDVPTRPAAEFATTGSLRAAWRWADPDAGGSGISGPANARGFLDAQGNYVGKVINANAYPIGGTPAATHVDVAGNTKGLYPAGRNGMPLDHAKLRGQRRALLLSSRRLQRRDAGRQRPLPQRRLGSDHHAAAGHPR